MLSKNTTMIIHITTNNKQNINVIFTSISSHNFIIHLFSSNNHKKIRYKIYKLYKFTKLFIVFWVLVYLYLYPPVKFRTNTITRRVMYPRVPAPSGKLPSLASSAYRNLVESCRVAVRK